MQRKPRTSMFTVRSDIRTIATLARYFNEKKGYAILNRSELVNYSLELLYLTIVRDGTEPFTQTDEALSYLNSLGLDTNTGGRGLNKVREQLQREAQWAEAGSFELPKDEAEPSEEDITEALDKLNQV